MSHNHITFSWESNVSDGPIKLVYCDPLAEKYDGTFAGPPGKYRRGNDSRTHLQLGILCRNVVTP